MSFNMSLQAFWFAQGKTCARDGKPAQFTLHPLQRQRYSEADKAAAASAYAAGYLHGLPEDARCECVLSVRGGYVCSLCRMRAIAK